MEALKGIKAEITPGMEKANKAELAPMAERVVGRSAWLQEVLRLQNRIKERLLLGHLVGVLIV